MRWIFCELEFKDRRRPLLQPGHYTELFFLDEATALAAGHRPCAECQRRRFDVFRQAWSAANPRAALGPRPKAAALDAALHADRLQPDGRQTTFAARLSDLPPGTLAARGPHSFLVTMSGPREWTPGGYGPAALGSSLVVEVLTPRSIVRMLAAGYQPDLHPSASATQTALPNGVRRPIDNCRPAVVGHQVIGALQRQPAPPAQQRRQREPVRDD